jgi:hypothetical protein
VATRCGRATLALFALNLALQVFDAVATYVGCHAGMVEGNPFVSYAMVCFGVGPGLALAKVQALALLGFLWYLRSNWLVPRALAVTAATYVAFSAVPWTVALFLPALS